MNKETLPQIGVGETLRMARERTGQDLRFVADMLRIRYAYLEAIESGDYQKLPGAPYALGFVRAYADHLSLNSVEIVERFKQERADLDQQTQLVFPKPLPEGKVPSGGILLVALMLGVFVYGTWFFLSREDKPIAELIPEIPARLMALVGAGEDEAEPAADDVATDGGQDDVEDPMAAVPPDEPPAEDAAVETPPADAAPDAERPAEASEPAPDENTEPAEPVEATVVAETAPDAAEPEAVETQPEQAAAAEPAPEPAPEPVLDTVRLDDAAAEAPAEVPAEEPADQTAALEAEAVPETDEAIAEPGETAAQAAPAETPSVDAAPEPAEPETQAAAAPEPDETEAEADESAADIAQRVLQEFSQGEGRPGQAEPQQTAAADLEPTPTRQSARVNGGSTGSDTPAQTPAPEVTVAAITPAARPPEAAPSRPGAKVYGEEYDQSRILITARVDSWVEVSTDQGELLLTRVLRAGDSFRVPDQDGLSLVTGNAGGLAISVDGTQVPDLGPVGAVRRGVELDPDRLKAGTAGNL